MDQYSLLTTLSPRLLLPLYHFPLCLHHSLIGQYSEPFTYPNCLSLRYSFHYYSTTACLYLLLPFLLPILIPARHSLYTTPSAPLRLFLTTPFYLHPCLPLRYSFPYSTFTFITPIPILSFANSTCHYVTPSTTLAVLLPSSTVVTHSGIVSLLLIFPPSSSTFISHDLCFQSLSPTCTYNSYLHS